MALKLLFSARPRVLGEVLFADRDIGKRAHSFKTETQHVASAGCSVLNFVRIIGNSGRGTKPHDHGAAVADPSNLWRQHAIGGYEESRHTACHRQSFDTPSYPARKK
jgi:hypothetical protein